jgi:prepilin-type N-terminal cleavage/methylation domain-containing protein
MKNKNRAFSLIELSIVVLIIGILIAGVTQGSRLVNASKVQTAQTLSQSAPVTSVQGLVLWLDSSREDSFISTEASNATQLTKWYNVNPQVANLNRATTSLTTFTNSSANITYKSVGINGLPSVSFANASRTSTFASPAGGRIVTPYQAYTIFVVARVTSIAATNAFLYNGDSATFKGFGVYSDSTGKMRVDGGTTSAFAALVGNASAIANAARIMTVTISPDSVNGVATTTPAAKFYVNGKSDLTVTNLSANISTQGPNDILYLGGTTAASLLPFVGDMSEVIMFDTVLKDSDRKSVEQYLGKKYGIAVAS